MIGACLKRSPANKFIKGLRINIPGSLHPYSNELGICLGKFQVNRSNGAIPVGVFKKYPFTIMCSDKFCAHIREEFCVYVLHLKIYTTK